MSAYGQHCIIGSLGESENSEIGAEVRSESGTGEARRDERSAQSTRSDRSARSVFALFSVALALRPVCRLSDSFSVCFAHRSPVARSGRPLPVFGPASTQLRAELADRRERTSAQFRRWSLWCSAISNRRASTEPRAACNQRAPTTEGARARLALATFSDYARPQRAHGVYTV